jgi:hypothetical protein
MTCEQPREHNSLSMLPISVCRMLKSGLGTICTTKSVSVRSCSYPEMSVYTHGCTNHVRRQSNQDPWHQYKILRRLLRAGVWPGKVHTTVLDFSRGMQPFFWDIPSLLLESSRIKFNLYLQDFTAKAKNHWHTALWLVKTLLGLPAKLTFHCSHSRY